MPAGSVEARSEFLRRNSPDGLLRRYARGRLRAFALRQTMTLIGSLVLSLLGNPWFGPLAVLCVLTGEGVEAAALGCVLRRRDGALPAWLRLCASVAAAVQAMTISACILLCWGWVPLIEARFFATVFLMSAVTNASLAARHFPEATTARIWVYGLTMGVMVMDLLRVAPHRGSLFMILSMVILAYAVILFTRTIGRSQIARYQFERALLDKQVALSQSRSELLRAARLSERLALVARHAADSILFTSPDGRIEWVNPAFTRITGYSFDEAVGRFPGDLLNAEETSPEALAYLLRAIEAGQSCRVQLQNRTKSGGRVWMDINMSPVFTAEGALDVFIALERDVTEERAQRAELAAARQTAEAAAQARAQFLATMSHEIRTPLNGVIGVAELLADTPLDPAQRHYARTIIDSGRALLTILNDVLDLTKLEAGKMVLEERRFSLPDLLLGSLDLMRPAARAKGIALTADLPENLPDFLGDAGRLRQVVLNLLGNAVKFTEQGGVTLRLSVSPGKDHDEMAIAVTDTGIGIPSERQERIFDSFSQADSTISRRFGGTGLGLTISRELMGVMGGRIALVSQTGAGTTFTATLPLRRAPGTAQGTPPVVAPPVTALRVLLADDNRTNRMIAEKLLGPCVAQLDQAADGEAALRLARAGAYDLVLMDISMPGMDGVQATRAIRAHEAQMGCPPVTIFALTAYSGEDDLRSFREAGMDGALAKPFVRAELYHLLRLLEERRTATPPPDPAVPAAPQGRAAGF
ncbi:hybrid sensor histidine kinase/response regulator [Gemmobacter caeruleus]|uniref:hybrid sensor histidine kinase/response regulator n=1 Tax=Gemmobacter caeruleus TaxID=2595004 RepID=UPI0011ED384F|nr:ATP-binding protein [Gemmobacter caeruleus]